MPRSTSQNFCCQCLGPCSEPQPPPTSAGDPPILAGRSGPVSYGATAFFLWVLVCMRLYVPSKSRDSVSPSPVEVLQSNPADLQNWILWGLLLLLLHPQAGKPSVGLRTFTLVGELLWYNCFPVCGSPPGRFWIWCYCDCTPPAILLWPLLCLWVSFLVDSNIFPSMGALQLVVIPVLSQEGVSACPSTPPSWAAHRILFRQAVLLQWFLTTQVSVFHAWTCK